MNAARDSVGIALPFAAGIALSIWSSGLISPYNGGLVATAALTAVFSTAFISMRSLQQASPMATRTAIGIMFFATGIFITFTRAIWSGCYSQPSPGPVSRSAADCAQQLKSLIDSIQYSDTETPALIKALLTGDKSGLGKATREAFRLSGASHLLALSGMHLGIIYLITSRLLSVLGHSRKALVTRAIIIIASSGFFTLMTGASPSIVRAFLFILLSETASVTGRTKSGTHILCTAFVIQLAAAPEIIESIGFQLSYLAMCGILFLYPTLRNWYPSDGKRGITGKIWDTAALSISCQAFTAPLVWFHFGTFPQYFILTNLVAIPLTTITMISSIAVAALTATGICPPFLITANEAAVTALRFTLETISTM